MAGYDFVVYLSLLCSIVFLSLSIVSIFLCFPIVSYVVLFFICLPLCAPSLLIFQLVLTVFDTYIIVCVSCFLTNPN